MRAKFPTPATVTNSSFFDNSRRRHLQHGQVVLDDVVTGHQHYFSENSAKWLGGAIYSQAEVTVANDTFFGNTAEYYGG